MGGSQLSRAEPAQTSPTESNPNPEPSTPTSGDRKTFRRSDQKSSRKSSEDRPGKQRRKSSSEKRPDEPIIDFFSYPVPEDPVNTHFVGDLPFPFKSLPKEIFKVLVEYLDFRDAVRLHSVMKCFSSALWENMSCIDVSTLWNCVSEEIFLHILDTKPMRTVNGMNFSQCNRINFYTLNKLSSSHLPYLRSLNLSHWLQMSSIEWKGILKLPKLTSLVLNDQAYSINTDDLFNLTNLEHLEAANNAFQRSPLKYGLSFDGLTRMTKLRVLSLGNDGRHILDDVLDFTPMHNLHAVTLRNFGGDMRIRGLEDKTGLRKLHLFFHPQNLASPLAGNVKLRKFLAPFTNLEDLSIIGAALTNNIPHAKTIHPLAALEERKSVVPLTPIVPVNPEEATPVGGQGEMKAGDLDLNIDLLHASLLSEDFARTYKFLRRLEIISDFWLFDSHDMAMIAPLRLFHLTCRIAEDAWACFTSLDGFHDLNTLNLSQSYCPKLQKRIAHLNSLPRLTTLILRHLQLGSPEELQQDYERRVAKNGGVEFDYFGKLSRVKLRLHCLDKLTSLTHLDLCDERILVVTTSLAHFKRLRVLRTLYLDEEEDETDEKKSWYAIFSTLKSIKSLCLLETVPSSFNRELPRLYPLVFTNLKALATRSNSNGFARFQWYDRKTGQWQINPHYYSNNNYRIDLPNF